jgi:uncharacterized protein (DUF305 family)
MKRKVASLLALGIIPFASLSLAGCTNATSSADPSNPNEATLAESSPGESPVAQMDHGSMGDSMPMNHGAMSMDLGPADESFDLRFIDAMTLHHQGAVVMAEEALEKSNRPEMKELAQTIIDAQQQEIAQMQSWRQAWYSDAEKDPVAFDAGMGHTMTMTKEMQNSMMMSGDLGGADDEFDLRFINAMIPHHEGAVVMAQEALEKSSRPEVKTLAQAIIDAQQPEIDQMTQWRMAWYQQ